MRSLHVDSRGYPVPWFVQWINGDGKAVKRGEGQPEFRLMDPSAWNEAVTLGRCWICGGSLGAYKSFVAGPMCGINRTSAEPPSHLDCADFAGRACPFLARPHMVRREAGLPDAIQEAPGHALKRNPGVSLIWTTKTYKVFAAGDGYLIEIGPPEHVRWYAEGRPATRDEVMQSVESGLPALREMATAEGPGAERQLDKFIDRFMPLVPDGAAA